MKIDEKPQAPGAQQLQIISEKMGLRIFSTAYVTSGTANHVFRAQTTNGTLILKLSKVDKPELFACEVQGLRHIASTGTVFVPEVLDHGPDFLALEDLGQEHKEISDAHWHHFGVQFGGLHRVNAEAFGYERDNFIGIWEQKNPWETDWVDFFYQNRVHCFLDSGRNREILSREDRDEIARLMSKLKDLIPTQPPSLCHGDFWINNLFRQADGRVYVIDPAIHFGLPEADLAMTQMYGFFPEAFYEGYRESHALLPDWKDRLPLYQLKELVLMIAQFAQEESIQKLRELIRRFC